MCKEKVHSIKSPVKMGQTIYKIYTIKMKNNTLFQVVPTPRYNS
jgi:hypothetical protein